LHPALAEEPACRAVVEPLFSNPRSEGAVAMANGVAVGFMFGERMLLPPSDFASQYIPPHSISIGIEYHAAIGAPALDVYRALYADLAARWVADGFFTHRVAIPAGDAEDQEAWVTLGFGRYLTAATRQVAAPVKVANPRALTIERASPEDIDDVLLLADDLNAWHWQAPIFWPILHATEPAAKQFNLGALRSAATPYFVAYDGGKPVGMQTFLRPGFTPPIVNREADVYLFEGIVASDARSGGIGATLLRHSMEWAGTEGFESCTLHFAPANPSGAPFWLGHGFVPVEHTMERVIDSRVAWARPRMHVGR
jgi:GNAT superfamily N-acetyltransferase